MISRCFFLVVVEVRRGHSVAGPFYVYVPLLLYLVLLHDHLSVDQLNQLVVVLVAPKFRYY
jgi:hypothetical protein